MEIHKRTLLVGALMLSALPVQAVELTEKYETQVIHTSKFAKPITDFVNTEGKNIMSEQVIDQQERRRQLDGIIAMANNKAEISENVRSNIFPVIPEIINRIRQPVRIFQEIPELPRPLFIIGNDEFSMQWFQSNKAELERFNAAGILTKVDSQEEFEKIQAAVAPFPIMPMSADALTLELGVPGYPVMITYSGFFQ